MEHMMPIGKFSKMTRLSIKALRHYDEIGLLNPAHIDEGSGYRYYLLTQAGRAEAIRYMRSVDMPLDTIQRILEGDESTIREELKRHHDTLIERLADQERMVDYLGRLIERNHYMPYEVEITQAPTREVASIRKSVSLRSIARAIEEGFGSVYAMVMSKKLAPADAPFIIFHDIIDEDTEGDIEICLPVNSVEESDGFRSVAGGPAATVTHQGPYAEIGPAYHTILGWMSDHGHEAAGPPREIYLNDPTKVDESDLLTRVEWPLAGDAG